MIAMGSAPTAAAVAVGPPDVRQGLDHSSLAITAAYLRRLDGPEDRSWAKVAESIAES